MKNILFCALTLIMIVGSTGFADQKVKGRKVAQTTPPDLADDVMKPMGKELKALVAGITDGTKNTSATTDSINKILNFIDQALTLTPDTDAYKATSARLIASAITNGGSLSAPESARLTQLEYTTFLNTVRALFVQLKTAVAAANANACGQTCTDLLSQIKDIQTLAHLNFQDPPTP